MSDQTVRLHRVLRAPPELDDPYMPGVLMVTVTLREIFCGTELEVVQENLPEAIPLAACYLGWQESLQQLAMLVEAEIPD